LKIVKIAKVQNQECEDHSSLLNLGTEISFLNSVVYFLLKKLLSVIKELESLKLIVRQEMSKLNSNADAEEPNGVYEICWDHL
jgi:hypothetical protein